MNAAELLTTVVIVTVLVTVLLLGVSYLGRRLDSEGKRARIQGSGDDSWYFVRFEPDGGTGRDS